MAEQRAAGSRLAELFVFITSTLLTVFVAFGACVALLPVVRYLARAWGLYDRLGELKIHEGAIPRLGGVAIAIAFCLAIIATGQVKGTRIWYFLGALALVWLVGLVDDIRDLPRSMRLVAQAAAGGLLYWGGWRAQISSLPIANLIVTLLVVLWFINAFNFADGSDGIAAGLSALACFGFLVIFADQHAPESAAITAALLGCSLGFLLFNFPPATIFMGDCGSTLVGLVLAALTLVSFRSYPVSAVNFCTPLLFTTVPLADAVFAVFRRLRGGRSPFSGDRRHFYDLLLQFGLSSRTVALISYVVAAMFVLAGMLARSAHTSSFFIFFAAALVITLGLILGSFRPDSQAARLDRTESARSGPHIPQLK